MSAVARALFYGPADAFAWGLVLGVVLGGHLAVALATWRRS